MHSSPLPPPLSPHATVLQSIAKKLALVISSTGNGVGGWKGDSLATQVSGRFAGLGLLVLQRQTGLQRQQPAGD